MAFKNKSTGVVNGEWVSRDGNKLPITTYHASTGKYVPYCENMHKYHFIWPFGEVIDMKVYVVAYPTSYTFRQREKVLKALGWHNTGPIKEKNCFLFAKKVDIAGGIKQNSPIQIALSFTGDYFMWISKGFKPEEADEQFKTLLNIVETVL